MLEQKIGMDLLLFLHILYFNFILIKIIDCNLKVMNDFNFINIFCNFSVTSWYPLELDSLMVNKCTPTKIIEKSFL